MVEKASKIHMFGNSIYNIKLLRYVNTHSFTIRLRSLRSRSFRVFAFNKVFQMSLNVFYVINQSITLKLHALVLL